MMQGSCVEIRRDDLKDLHRTVSLSAGSRVYKGRAAQHHRNAFKQQGRGGEANVIMTLAMQPDGTLKVRQDLNGNKQEGTGKKKT